MNQNRSCFGTIIIYVIFGLLPYGLFFRPLFSTKIVVNEEVELQSSDWTSFKIDLRSKVFNRKISLEYDVIQGEAIDILLIKPESSATTVYISNFSQNSVMSGNTSAIVTPGLWFVMLRPSNNQSTQTKVRVKCKTQRPRFFENKDETTSLNKGGILENWEMYISPDKKFSISLPSKPKEEISEIEPFPDGEKVPIKRISSLAEKSNFQAKIEVVWITHSEIGSVYEDWSNEFVKGVLNEGGSIKEKIRLSSSSYLYKIDYSDYSCVIKSIFDDETKTLYQITIATSIEKKTDPIVMKFVDSFKILN